MGQQATHSSVLLACCVACCFAQHDDPFAGSGCNCSAFCAGSCAINASKPSTRALYRMTPLGVDGLEDKNTGDAKGDTSYVISRRTAAFDCKKDPGSFQCANLVVTGDDPYSTDLVIEFQVEVDGQWGPYLYCNPLDAKHPTQPWNCSTHLSGGPGPPPGYPETCAAAYDGFAKFCLNGKPDSVTNSTSGISGCCAAASAAKAAAYTYHTSNSSCEVHQHFSFHQSSFFECADGVVGLMTHGPPKPPCQCPRVFSSVGRENLTASGSHGGGFGGAGGEWLSHPHQGMCAQGAPLGKDGCSWRVVGAPLAVNASCVYNRLDANVEAANTTGFAPCPKVAGGGLNRTSDCYSECYKYTTDGMTPEQLVAPWEGSFSGTDPCPPVTITAAAVAAAAVR